MCVCVCVFTVIQTLLYLVSLLLLNTSLCILFIRLLTSNTDTLVLDLEYRGHVLDLGTQGHVLDLGCSRPAEVLVLDTEVQVLIVGLRLFVSVRGQGPVKT